MNFCLVCKIPLRKEIICAYCRAGLLDLKEPTVRDEKIYRIRSLFAWRRTSPKALEWLIKSLKNHEQPDRWIEFASWMMLANGARENSVLVPIPSRNKNHALGLCKALHQLTGIPIQEALAPGDDESHRQKRLSRERRNEVQFERAIWSYCTEYTNVIVVDDVVTTGATSRAAYHALGRPKRCEVWCLMDRRPCGR